MTDFQIPKSFLFDSLPPIWPEDVKPQIREILSDSSAHKLIVLDDDPTGTQTIHDLPVLTTWDVDTLTAEFHRPGSCFYILTNSRSLIAEQSEALNREIAINLLVASSGKTFTVVSRSDSTLRGHFPLETDVLAAELGPFDATLIIPYFEAGGRYTVGDVHYVAEGDQLIPAANTPFAKDAVFGYNHSNLREWVQEKTLGHVPASDVSSVSLETIRSGGPEAVCAQLIDIKKGSICIVNAAALRDIEVFALGFLKAQKSGKRYLVRSAAQIVAALLGEEPRPLLCSDDLNTGNTGGGLIIVGSYVTKTTAQLKHLFEVTDVARVEIKVPDLLDSLKRCACLAAALSEIHHALRADQDVVVFTSRDLILGCDAAGNLHIGNSVSEALVEIVQRLSVRPRYIIAKGGITSSDLATRGLGVKRAIVMGQLLPGIPVWRLGDEVKFPRLDYVVFPGNVGGSAALAQAVEILTTSFH